MSSFSPDLILYGGKIAMMDTDDRFVSALAVHNGKIAAVGTDDDIRALAGAGTEVSVSRGARRSLASLTVMPTPIAMRGGSRIGKW